jgi:hypothetical protein
LLLCFWSLSVCELGGLSYVVVWFVSDLL